MYLSKFVPLLSLALLLAACDRGTPAPPATAPAVESPGDTDPANWGHLPFRITAAYLNQQLTEDYPGHADGGNWTFLDCDAGNARFVVGVQVDALAAPAPDNPDAPALKGHAILRIADRDAADAFLAAFADAFHTAAPEPLTPKPLRPMVFPTSIVGTSLARATTGSGFVLGGGGTWTAIRWNLATPRLDAEVFFNFDIATQQGEFIEKDPASRGDLLALWARVLRDGPRGMRTPMEDRNVVTVGPHLGNLTPIAGPQAIHPFFVPGGKWLIYTLAQRNQLNQTWAVETAQPDHQIPLLQLPIIYQVQCADPTAQRILIEEKISDIPGVVSNADPSRFVWYDATIPAARIVSGPWNPRDVDCDPNAISPDSRYLVLSEARTREDGKGAFTQLYIVDLLANTASIVAINQQFLQTFGWHNTGENLRLIARTGLPIDPPESRHAVLIDPVSGNWVAASAVEVSPILAPSLPSPDGQNVAVVLDHQRLEIRRATGVTRTLIFNPEDRRFVEEDSVAWLDNRYLSFFNPYPIIIDTGIMKMNYLLNSDRSPHDVIYSPDFRYAAVLTDEGLSLAPILDVRH